MKSTYRIFFKKKTDSPKKKTCKHIEITAGDIDGALKVGKNIAKKEKLRVVLVAELAE